MSEVTGAAKAAVAGIREALAVGKELREDGGQKKTEHDKLFQW